MTAQAAPQSTLPTARDPWLHALAATLPGTRSHAEQVRRQLQALLSGLRGAARTEALGRLEHLLCAARTDEIWALLKDADGRCFPTWAAFCTASTPYGLGVPVGVLDALVAERRDPRVRARLALAAARKGQGLERWDANASRRVAVFDANGKFAGSLPSSAPRRPQLKGPAAQLARLARDRPDVLAALERGEYPSIRAAALAAGIVLVTVQVMATADSFARAALKHLALHDRAQLIAYLQHPETVPPPSSRQRLPAKTGRTARHRPAA